MIAVRTAIGSVLLGKKSKDKYPEKPFMYEEKKDLTEKEKANERENFLMYLNIMQNNFERSKERADKV